MLQQEAILAQVTDGSTPYTRSLNFWAVVYSDAGIILASGRPVDPSLEEIATSPIGVPVETIANEEAGFSQPGLWNHIFAAAENEDGYFSFSGYDGYSRVAHTNNAVTRVGYVQRVTTQSGRVLYASSAFSDVPLVDSFGGLSCSPANDQLCAISYSRQVVGTVATALLRAETAARVQEVLAGVTWRRYNQQATDASVGFYPFVYRFDPTNIHDPSLGGGTCLAHGSASANVDRTIADIIAGAGDGDLTVGLNLGISFSEAALEGGGYVAYTWRGVRKVSLIVGLRRFGVTYYLGVGFNHVSAPLGQGPGCGICDMNYNYPCSWHNVLSLVGHVQSLMLMAKGTEAVTVDEALSRITHSPLYNADQDLVSRGGSTAAALYAFVYRYSDGMCVAHGVRSDWLYDATHAASFDQAIYRDKADAGGGWVSYQWRNNPDEPEYLKSAYIVKVTRDGESFYIGVGLSQLSYTFDGMDRCSFNWKSGCAERWAYACSGLQPASWQRGGNHWPRPCQS